MATGQDRIDAKVRQRQVKVSILSAITHKAAGDSHSQCKHKDATVAEARRLHKEGMSRGEIARRTGVPYQTLMDWLNGRSRVVSKIKKTTIVETEAYEI